LTPCSFTSTNIKGEMKKMSDFDIGGRRYDIPEIPNNLKRLTGIVIILLIIAIAGVVVVSTAAVRIPSG